MRFAMLVLTLSGCSLAWGEDPHGAMTEPDAGVESDAIADSPADAPRFADLHVQLGGLLPHVAAGGQFTLRVDVGSYGPSPANEVEVQLSGAGMFYSIEGEGWQCSVQGLTAGCRRPTASPGVTPSITVHGTAPNAMGGFTVDATVLSATLDANAANNLTQAVSTVGSSGAFGTAAPYSTGVEPRAVGLGDFNGDGRVDVVTANTNQQGSNPSNIGSVSVLLGTAAGTLQAASNFTAGYGPESLAVGDFNRDGALDVVTANMGYGMGGNITVLIGNGNGSFRAPVAYAACCSPQDIETGDLDGDGKLDLVIANYFSVQVLIGNGLGGFAAPVSYSLAASAFALALGDLDNNGKLDVIVGYTDAVVVLKNGGNGTLLSPVVYANPGRGLPTLATADFDRDGWLDVITSNRNSSSASLFRGSSTGALLAPAHHAAGNFPIEIAAADVNGDGNPDFVVTNVDNGVVTVRLGNGDGMFQAGTGYPTSSPLALAIGDVNRDGRPDLAVANGVDGLGILYALP